MTTFARCHRCGGSHCRCTGCGTRYGRDVYLCVTDRCRDAAPVCRCGAIAGDTGGRRNRGNRPMP
jgi:hypothetical protein